MLLARSTVEHFPQILQSSVAECAATHASRMTSIRQGRQCQHCGHHCGSTARHHAVTKQPAWQRRHVLRSRGIYCHATTTSAEDMQALAHKVRAHDAALRHNCAARFQALALVLQAVALANIHGWCKDRFVKAYMTRSSSSA